MKIGSMKMKPGRTRSAVAMALCILTIAGLVVVSRSVARFDRVHVVAYFANSNGIFPGDAVLMLGVPIGKIDAIEPQPLRAKITFWFSDKYKVPADANALIISPQLITARAIQLTPAYNTGPQMRSGATIPQERTAVPVEWDDLRQQLDKFTAYLQPTGPGGVSSIGEVINAAAGNLRGQGMNIRSSIIELARVLSALGDHSNDIFSTTKNLAILVSALSDSATTMRTLNVNLAAVTALLADSPNEVGRAVEDINTAVTDVRSFVAENKDTVGITTEKLASISAAVHESLDDIKQTLHIAPTTLSDLDNIYEPAHAALTGALAVNNFANPIQFLCSAIQAASRLRAEQSAKLCVQYLAPIVKNRQYNFLPFGVNLFANAQARPNEITYSEPWMRPDYVPPPVVPPEAHPTPNKGDQAPLASGAPPPTRSVPTDPGAGLTGMMVPAGGGS
jgi:phospholipid/cholesterol/gamma-HCH transport system substrate-binding protein